MVYFFWPAVQKPNVFHFQRHETEKNKRIPDLKGVADQCSVIFLVVLAVWLCGRQMSQSLWSRLKYLYNLP